MCSYRLLILGKSVTLELRSVLKPSRDQLNQFGTENVGIFGFSGKLHKLQEIWEHPAKINLKCSLRFPFVCILFVTIFYCLHYTRVLNELTSL